MPELSARNIQINNLIGDALDAIKLKMRKPLVSNNSVKMTIKNNIPVAEYKGDNNRTCAIREVDKLNRPKGLFVGSDGQVKAIVVNQSEKKVEIGTFKYELSSYIDEEGIIRKAQINKLIPVKLDDCKIECSNTKINLMEIMDKYKDYQLIYM